LERLRKTFAHEVADRVPISDFFCSFRKAISEPGCRGCRSHHHYDLDFIVTVQHTSHRSFETTRTTRRSSWTGFETTIRKRFDLPMPEQVSWETDTIEKLEAFEFDDPADRHRFFEAGDNQIAGVGDGFERNSPPWVDTLQSLHADFPVYAASPGLRITTRLSALNTLTDGET
jgi:hypothetical protein